MPLRTRRRDHHQSRSPIGAGPREPERNKTAERHANNGGLFDAETVECPRDLFGEDVDTRLRL